jgi:hypothetical protein
MNRNYYYRSRAREQQQEISKELAARHLLKETETKLPAAKELKRIMLWIMPAAIVMAALILLHFSG